MDMLVIAQGVETAEKGLSLLQKINAGGVPLICLVVAALCGVAFYWQLKANNKMQKDALSKAEEREDKAATAGQKRLEENESLLREMLDRDKEAQETHSATAQAIQNVTTALQDQKRACDETNQLLQSHTRLIEESNRTQQQRTEALKALLKENNRVAATRLDEIETMLRRRLPDAG